MQTIMESEMAYWMGRQSAAVMAYGAMAVDDTPAVSIADAIALHQEYPVTGSAEQIYLLRMTNSEFVGARAELNAALAGDHDTWWEVQDLYLAQLEAGLDAKALDAAQEQQLENYAVMESMGATNAQSWLAELVDERPRTARSL